MTFSVKQRSRSLRLLLASAIFLALTTPMLLMLSTYRYILTLTRVNNTRTFAIQLDTRTESTGEGLQTATTTHWPRSSLFPPGRSIDVVEVINAANPEFIGRCEERQILVDRLWDVFWVREYPCKLYSSAKVFGPYRIVGAAIRPVDGPLR